MPYKHLVLNLFLLSFSFCICAGAHSQNIEVNLKVSQYSPYIKKYTKEQMTRMLLDSVISYCRSRYLKLGRHINIYARGSAQPTSNLPRYKLELSLGDSIFNTDRFTDTRFVFVKSKFYEEEIPAADIMEWASGGGGSYGKILRGETKAIDITEAQAIDAYFTFANIRAGTSIDWSMPLSLTERISSRNIFEKDELDKLESFSEMVVKMEVEKLESKKSDIDRLTTMINNIFFSKQGRISNRRSLNKGRSQFNYYLTTDSLGYTGPTVYGNPIELKLIIESMGQNAYQVKLEFDEQKYSLKDFFGVPKKERVIPVSVETLRKRPSEVNKDITDLIETFVNSNTR